MTASASMLRKGPSSLSCLFKTRCGPRASRHRCDLPLAILAIRAIETRVEPLPKRLTFSEATCGETRSALSTAFIGLHRHAHRSGEMPCVDEAPFRDVSVGPENTHLRGCGACSTGAHSLPINAWASAGKVCGHALPETLTFSKARQAYAIALQCGVALTMGSPSDRRQSVLGLP